ncbi:unnamed protein product (macronuclear) [Paramecium tetraurelia]|uniref:Uncharacterized protein n=1 Tax=Paramecium tetraurelia TaxID=5888 RepID=A0D7N0_PARTE|nr:uncharacterized protein GSPATT00014014001 [Paramecium tetraurelia]CAK79047.1 unnamed protein product [Paramecium tetraurelia]|eukprot:XP_001446444.1 hypothetical protein (macronuclear) [Paramecium tetraurelia strain d4-2]
MATARIPFSNVTQVNKGDRLSATLGEKVEKSANAEKQFVPTNTEINNVKNSLDELQLENVDKQTLIQQLKLHKIILKHCFEENDILRERIAAIEAQFSNLQDEIEMRDNVILELSEKLEQKEKE